MLKTIIAGPCSVESRQQLQSVVEALCHIPHVQLVRGGVWKPRTRPGGFEGLGEPALQWMKEIADSDIRMADGSPVRFCCEVARPEHVELCHQYAVHDVWLGARTTANPFMVEELCNALRGSGMNVMVKNPLSPDVRLWMGAVERLQQCGVTVSAAIHRGFSMYDNHGYRNDPLWEVPMELRRLQPDLPILCDPSHIAGSSSLVPSVARAAMQLAFDGLMLEVHPSPEMALTDAVQQLTPEGVASMLHTLNATAEGVVSDQISAELALLRGKIDGVDRQLLQLLVQRMQCSRQIAELKRQSGMAVYQSDRWAEVVDDRLRQAGELGLDTTFIKELLEKIHGESVRIQMD